jgi:hypothetical protein
MVGAFSGNGNAVNGGDIMRVGAAVVGGVAAATVFHGGAMMLAEFVQAHTVMMQHARSTTPGFVAGLGAMIGTGLAGVSTATAIGRKSLSKFMPSL